MTVKCKPAELRNELIETQALTPPAKGILAPISITPLEISSFK